MPPATTLTRSDPRIAKLLARLRRRQLETALSGHIDVSARYAQRAWRVRLFGKRTAM